jgi:hypothetical protein
MEGEQGKWHAWLVGQMNADILNTSALTALHECRHTENRNTYIKQKLSKQFTFVNQALKHYVKTRGKM